MSKLTKAAFIDALLDKWDSAGTKDYFTTITSGLDTTATATATATAFATPATPATPKDIQDIISQLYLVFHYPQYENSLNNETKFDALPSIDNKTVFNYVAGPPESKRLLSSKGISKPNMVTLKMIIGELASADTTNASAMITILLSETEITDVTTNTTVLGGNNNTLIPKTGGKGKNKSSKRVKKHPRRRNKSSKSLI
jgi:hypothetical protein